MTKLLRCDACGKETDSRMWASLANGWVSVEANEDEDHFDACSWACVAEMALRKAARTMEES